MLIPLSDHLVQCQETCTHDTIRNDEGENKQCDSIRLCKKKKEQVECFFKLFHICMVEGRSPCSLDGTFFIQD